MRERGGAGGGKGVGRRGRRRRRGEGGRARSGGVIEEWNAKSSNHRNKDLIARISLLSASSAACLESSKQKVQSKHTKNPL